MKILVTGSNGFLGSYFKNNFSNNSNKFIYGTTSKSNDNNYKIFDDLYHNIDDNLLNEKVEAIIHFASIIPNNFEEASYKLFENNIIMMNNLYNFAIKNNLKKFIYLSTFGSMNNPELLDIKDFYTMSKITGEHFCSIMENKNIASVSFRISAPYGEYSKTKNVINIFIDKAVNNENITIFGSGAREQNFTYVGDILNAIELVLNKNITGTYNIVSQKNVSMLDLAKLIIDLTSSKSKIVFNNQIDPQEDYRPNYSYHKAYKDFGFKPTYNLKDGLKKYLNWYINQ